MVGSSNSSLGTLRHARQGETLFATCSSHHPFLRDFGVVAPSNGSRNTIDLTLFPFGQRGDCSAHSVLPGLFEGDFFQLKTNKPSRSSQFRVAVSCA